MLKRTRSILEELDSFCSPADQQHVIESRASNIIASATRLIEQIESVYTSEAAEDLTRKLLNAIKAKDSDRFKRALRRVNESK